MLQLDVLSLDDETCLHPTGFRSPLRCLQRDRCGVAAGRGVWEEVSHSHHTSQSSQIRSCGIPSSPYIYNYIYISESSKLPVSSQSDLVECFSKSSKSPIHINSQDPGTLLFDILFCSRTGNAAEMIMAGQGDPMNDLGNGIPDLKEK